MDVEGEDGNIGWARMHCEGGARMFLAAEEPVDPAHFSVMLYLYTPDLPALREHPLASGVEVPPIGKPHDMPSGEICLRGPDGNTVLVGHWGEQEHQDWLQQIGEKKQAGRL